ncbi:hypothetical protein, partial [Mycobacterium sp. 1245801.1]|uniref:hypothetical protein n=1 Tax=Mycobacterium sp. 1245801.1 TaxID=1834075 RepID=UPI000A56EF62
PDVAPQTPHATTNATKAFLTMVIGWRVSPHRRAGVAFARIQEEQIPPMLRFWHRYILGHRLAGPREEGDYRVWRDLDCGRDFRALILRVDPDAPPL